MPQHEKNQTHHLLYGKDSQQNLNDYSDLQSFYSKKSQLGGYSEFIPSK